MLSSVEMFRWNNIVSQFFRSEGKSKYKGLLTFWIWYKDFKGGRKFILARPHFGEYLALTSSSISDWTGMPSDNALPRPVSPRLILTSGIFPRLVFPGFPYSSKTSTLNSSCKCHLLKQFLFHILHVTQSRVSMGLTVSRKPVKKLAVRRKNWQIWTLSCRKKSTLKIFPSYNVLFSVILG